MNTSPISVGFLQPFPLMSQSNGLGKLAGHQVHLHIDKNVAPVVQKHRRTPFHLRKMVEAEVKRFHSVLTTRAEEKQGGCRFQHRQRQVSTKKRRLACDDNDDTSSDSSDSGSPLRKQTTFGRKKPKPDKAHEGQYKHKPQLKDFKGRAASEESNVGLFPQTNQERNWSLKTKP